MSHWNNKINYKIEVYKIQATADGYYGGIDGILQKDATSESLSNWFHTNKNGTLPDPASGNGITANTNLASYFPKRTWEDLTTAKSEILTDEFISTLATNCWSVDYYLREGNLILSCFFDDETKENNVALALANTAWYKIDGAVHSTIPSI